MAVSAAINLALQATEDIDLGLDNVDNPTVVHQVAGGSKTLNASSTPAATKAWSDQRQLSGGSDSIDLTALANGNLANIDFTGLKVQVIKIVAAEANTAAITIADGATNGYHVFGDGSGQINLVAGGQALIYVPEGLPDVGASAKTIDVTSSDTDAIYDIVLIAG